MLRHSRIAVVLVALLVVTAVPSRAQNASAAFALQFDGTDEFVALPDAPEINETPRDERTIEAWFKVDDASIFTRKQVIFEAGGTTNGFNIYVFVGAVYVGAWSEDTGFSGDWLQTSSIQSGTWHHVALVYDKSSSFTGYLDGSVFGSVGVSNTIDSHDGDNAFGRMQNNTKFHDGESTGYRHELQGSIDEGRVWNAVRTQSQIQNNRFSTLSGSETGLAGYWPFEEGSGGTTSDVASGNDGTLLNGVAWTSDDPLPPAAPTGLATMAGGAQVDLSWDANSESDLDGYNVYRATSSFSDPSGATKVSVVTSTSFTDTGLSEGTTYHYRITAVDGAGNESSLSGEATATATNTSVTYYVDGANGSDANDGQSWGQAFATLQQALSVATGADEIWIAEGTYTPTDGTNRSVSFTVIGAQSGLEIYGGFAGGETDRGDRDPAAHPVILSGDIGTPDDSSDNSFHVLVFDGGNGIRSDVAENVVATLLDGVTVTGGNADGGGSDSDGGGLYCDGSGSGNVCNPTIANATFTNNSAQFNGAAIYSDGNFDGASSPEIINVTFSDNSSNNGGAMYNGGSSGGYSSPTIRNSIFTNNSASEGGAIYSFGRTDGTSSPEITNVIFSGNSADDGGAIFNDGFDGTSSPQITNVAFFGNSASNQGGAIYSFGRAGGTSSPQITNATFSGNSASSEGGAIYNNGDTGTSSPQITNTILWGNSAASGSGDEIFNNSASSTLSHTLIEGGVNGSGVGGNDNNDGGNNLDADPLFADPSDPDGPDDTFATGDDGLRLHFGSPAIDVGNNGAIPVFVGTDITGAARIQNGTVDLGAYEGGFDPALTFHVDANTGDDAKYGTSWDQAFATLQKALSMATDNDEIWIAEGTYYPDEGGGVTEGDRSASFTVTSDQNGLEIYGGFASGDAFDDRSPADHPVILSGDIDQNDATNGNDANSFHVLFFDGASGSNITTATVLDGVTVTAGNATGGSSPDDDGGALYCDGSGSGNECSPTLTNVTFADNSAAGNGGAMFNRGDGGTSSPQIINATFTANSADDGGAMFNDGGSGGTSSPQIVNSVFVDNGSNSGNGGAMFNRGDGGTSSPQIINATFTANSAGDGGAIYSQVTYGGTSTPTITNTILHGNSAPNGGNEIVNDGGATPVIAHSLVEGSGGSGSGWDADLGTDGGGNLDADPLFTNAGDVNGADDVFATSDDGLRLQSGSPAVDAGEDAALPDGVTTDITGAPRIHPGTTVDLGAYEGRVSPTTYFVDGVNGSDDDEGNFWSQAFATLQQALRVANAHDEIWIAEGTYYPDQGGGATEGDRSASFTVTGGQDGLEIYGGFQNGDAFADRSPADHPVVLSGDIDQNDDASGTGSNSFHVLFFDGTTGGTITTATVLSGLTVTAGNADGSDPDDNGGGLLCDGSGSGNACSPQIQNVIFSGNTASNHGGAIYSDSEPNGVSSPQMSNVTFSGNTASNQGGAIYSDGQNGGTSSPQITNATFSGNTATRAGAIYNAGTGGTSTPQITNSILWGNSATNSDEIFNADATPTVRHTLIEGGVNGPGVGGDDNTDDGNNLDADPLFADLGDPDGADDTFATADDGLRLRPGSPVLNAGDDGALPADASDLDGDGNTTEPIPFDLTGAGRVQNGTVDLGAYETDDPSLVIFVDTDAGGDDDGTSWTDAFADLQDALAAATGNDEIWIADGTYTPTDGTDRSVSFTVTGARDGAQDGLEIYGGFAGGETDRSERDPSTNPVVLSGDIGTAGDDADNSFHVLFFDGASGSNITTATVLDGVTVTAGNATGGSSPDDDGGALYCDGSGSGNECSPTLTNVTFADNSAADDGGAIYNDGGSGGTSSSTLTNVTFSGNSADDGGAMINDGNGGISSPTLTNATFSGNTASNQGGAIYNNGTNGTSRPMITNSILWGNTAMNGGGEIFNNTARSTLSHTLIEGGVNGPGVGGDDNNNDGNNLDADPLFLDSSDPDGPDDVFATGDDGLRLLSGSPAINTGTDAAVPNGVTTDVTGAVRIQDGTVDLGAYEGGVELGAPAAPTGLATTAGDAQANLSWDANGESDLAGYNVYRSTSSFDDPSGATKANESLVPGTSFTDTGLSNGTTYHYRITAVDDGGNESAPSGEATVTPTDLTFYVDHASGSDANDGQSWGQAFATLQKALSVATDNDEIWIAEGTYYPDEGPGVTEGDPEATFLVSGAQNGLQIYGGFAGGETDRSERDPSANPVVLSGDIGTAGDDSDNSFHVLVFVSNTSIAALTADTVLDGVTVRGGNANGSFDLNQKGGGLLCYSDGNGCSPTLSNVIFTDNTATLAGGAIGNVGSNGSTSSLQIINASFTGNSARFGGAIFNERSTGSSNPQIVNSTFTNNSAEDGGALFNLLLPNGGTNSPQITNSILHGNNATNSGDEIFNHGATPTLRHTLIEGGLAGIGESNGSSTTDGGDNLDADPLFLDAADPDGDDDTFATDDDGLRVQAGSPALDAGDNAAVPSGVTTDITGADRIQESTVDLGAYEGPAAVGLTIDGTPGADGTDAGWRFIGIPTSVAVNAGDLRLGGQAPLFDLPDGHMLQRWNDEQGTGTTGGYEPIESADETLQPGRGYAVFLFDQDPFALDPSMTIDVAGDPPPRGGQSVTINPLAQSAQWHLLANPYPTGYDLSSLTDLPGNGFQAQVQRYDATTDTWVVEDQSTTDLAAWQGFFIERTDPGGATPGASSATFDPAGRIPNPPFVGSMSREEAPPVQQARIAFELVVTGAEGDTLSRDAAAQVLFDERAAVQWDAWDGSKLVPLGAEYALLAPEGLGRDSTATRKAVESRPWPTERQEIPLRLTAEDLPNTATATLSVHPWELPDGWRARIVDIESGQPLPLDPGASHEVVLPADTAAAPRYELQVAPTDASLPVELAGFEATEAGEGGVLLQWQTASETNNAQFRVQRKASVKGSRRDASPTPPNQANADWITIGDRPGAGTTTEPQTYRFTDADLPYTADTLAYRLKQIDTDGTEHLSDVITVGRSAVEQVQLHGSFPNPARTQATIRYALPRATDVHLDVYDLLGRRVMTLAEGRQEAGRKQLPLDASRLASGTYFYRLTAGETTRTRKLTVVR